jgi:hypothetical protein
MRRSARCLVGAVVVAALTAGAGPAMATAEPGPDQVTLLLREAVAALPEAAEQREGYDREGSFGDWVDADRDGCSTRAEVLLAEAVTAPEVTGRCTITPDTGSWFSWYDGVTVTSARSLDIDHVVPLAEAWDSGAFAWTREKRVEYANYLGDERHLEAVTGRSNRSKADRDPAEWLPPDTSVTCRYLAYWTSVKLTWDLTVDPAEQQRLTDLAAACPNDPLTYTPVT